MHSENIKSFAIAMIAALGFLLGTVPMATAQKAVTCNAIISDGRTIDGSLVVPPGNVCNLANVTVVGNVSVGTGATLNVFPVAGQTVTIDGNIAADGCRSVALGFLEVAAGVISVEGNVKIQNCTSQSGYAGTGGTLNVTISGNFVCTNNSVCIANGGVVQGNLTVDNNQVTGGIAPAVNVTGNQIGGNADISGNIGSSSPTVTSNAIGGNLQCFNNSPPPREVGTPNTVSGHKQGQCANF